MRAMSAAPMMPRVRGGQHEVDADDVGARQQLLLADVLLNCPESEYLKALWMRVW